MPDFTKIIAEPLAKRIKRDETALYRVIIALDTKKTTVGAASARVVALVKQALENADRTEQHILTYGDEMHPYVRARLQGKVIEAFVKLDQESGDPPGPVITEVRTDVDYERYFNPDDMVRSVISLPMLSKIEADEDVLQSVLIEVNVNSAHGRKEAKERVKGLVRSAIEGSGGSGEDQFVSDWKSDTSEQYVYAKLTGKAIQKLVELDKEESQKREQEDEEQQKEKGEKRKRDWRLLYHIWPDFKLRAQVWKSAATVKADACRRSFATTGRGIVWAIFDSGIDGLHPHFKKHSNLELPSGLTHMDFTGANPTVVAAADLTDEYGHGTHVAGIIAGELPADYQALSLTREKDQEGRITYRADAVAVMVMGVAPECTLLSYRVLDKNGEGDVSTVIAAIQMIQELNGYGRHIMIHGVNMSLGYDFDPEWFACGQSPVCAEVDRLVRSGVAVVIAAGNTGKGFALTINDPGNAELAVTVGATHREMPHRYGVSYFSSKGPTGDGRRKPDVLAPGERIISCGAGPDLQTYLKKAGGAPPGPNVAYYLERSGTSMAAPHVSGIIAGILSTRGEFIGLPEEMKDLLVNNATDLGRDRNFQGGGLVDMMRTIQAV
ncbi:MAG TPA: S8 family peptidase [Bryobacteraceae bacterium]|nr:S8 family peptidase [Bryobacteraceae bacterium]